MLPRSLCAPFQSLQPLPDLQAWPPMCFFLITWFGFSHSTLCLQLCHSHCCSVFIVWRYNLFIHFTVHGHLSHFYFVAITYRAAVGHLSHIFWSAYGLTQCLAFFFPFLKRFIYFLFLAVVSLRYGMRAFSSSREWGLLRSCGAVASLVVEHRL